MLENKVTSLRSYRQYLSKNQCIVFSNYLYLHSRTKFLKDSPRTLFRFWF
ncbi:TauD/TfdA family dioxygenase [Photorhabdus sp. UCH-936]|nr:TauD/TfdA family dioxygenase [Photorhabdus antumapuensis]